MRKNWGILGAFIAGVVIAMSYARQNKEQKIAGDDGLKAEAIHRIALIRELPLSVQDYGERLIDDILTLSNREEQVALMDRFVREIKSLSSCNLDLRLRCQELARCRLLTEKACDGYRKMGGHTTAIWNLRLAMLTRYVNTTNECNAEWGKFDAYEKARQCQEPATGRFSYMGTGQGQSGWLKTIEGNMDHYLLEIAKWLYRVDSHELSMEARNELKADIKRVIGRSLDFVEPRE